MLFFRPNVPNLTAATNIKGLINALRYKRDFKVRAEAAAALGQFNDASVVPALIAALNDRWAQVQEAAATALGYLRDPRAVEPLIGLLEVQGTSTRPVVETALAAIGDPRAIEPLIKRLSEASDARELKALIRALVGFGMATARMLVDKWSSFAWIDTKNRLAAVEVLGGCASPIAIEPLTKGLRDREKSVRIAAANALDALGWKPDPDECESAAYYWTVRRHWAHCLSLSECGIKALLDAYDDEREDDERERNQIKEALQSVGISAIRPLIAALVSLSHAQRYLAMAVLREIARRGAVDLLEFVDETMLQPVFAALQNDSHLKNEYACKALDFLGWSPSGEAAAWYWANLSEYSKCIQLGSIAVPALIEHLKRKGEPKISEILGNIGDDRAVPALFKELDRVKYVANNTQREKSKAAVAIALYNLFTNDRISPSAKTAILDRRFELEQAAAQRVVTSVAWFDAEQTTEVIGQNIQFPL